MRATSSPWFTGPAAAITATAPASGDWMSSGTGVEIESTAASGGGGSTGLIAALPEPSGLTGGTGAVLVASAGLWRGTQ